MALSFLIRCPKIMYELHIIYVLIAPIDRKNWVPNKDAY